MYMLWFNFILGLNFIFLCFKLIIIHYHSQKQRQIKFKPRIKLNHNIYDKVLYYLWSALLKPNSAKFVWIWNKVHILMPILYYNEAAFFWYLALSLVNKICADHQQPLQAKRF